MAAQQSRWAAARRSPAFWVLVAAVVAALVAGGVVLATNGTPPPSPAVSTRAVALGDSVPYGHGLANPYLTPQLGLPPQNVSQGPSSGAYPSAVARSLGLTMSVRPTNCALTGDQLAISGAVADPVDNTAPDGQCLHPPQQARNLPDELSAADLARHPARLVLLQDGADDTHFAECLEFELTHLVGSFGLGTDCVAGGHVTPVLATELAHVRTSLAAAIEEVAPHAGTVAVLDYYQPVPPPGQEADDVEQTDLGTNLVCTGLKLEGSAAYAAAQVVLGGLNDAVAGAVADARSHGVRNVVLVDIAHTFDGHGLCTADPWVFSSELIPDTTLADDVARVAAAKACTAATGVLHTSCGSLSASAAAAKQSLKGYVWRTAHPTPAGQQAIGANVERALRALASGPPSNSP
ncbi:MAG TPA: hypothetical protein VHS57_05895 [Acidimicrobiales bacterium]|nr:hypothetical protein [Acidimicrobiales bacterium]